MDARALTREAADRPARVSGQRALSILASSGVLAGLVAVPGALLVMAVVTSGLVRWVYLCAMGLIVVAAWPRGLATTPTRRLDDDVCAGLVVFAGAVAQAIALPAPAQICGTVRWATTASASQGRRGSVLVVSLPQWYGLDNDGRVAALAHALTLGADSRWSGSLIERSAARLVESAIAVLAVGRSVRLDPSLEAHADLGALGPGDQLAARAALSGASRATGEATTALIAAPARALARLLARLRRPAQRAALADADAAALSLVGAGPVARFLAGTVPPVRGRMTAAVAARNRQDPFAALAVLSPLTPAEVAERLARDPDLQARVSAWGAADGPAEHARPWAAAVTAADADVRREADRQRAAFVDALVNPA